MRAAQRELYNRYSPKMLAVCYRFAHNREDAEDMLQEGFIKVFLQIHTFENRGAFEGLDSTDHCSHLYQYPEEE